MSKYIQAVGLCIGLTAVIILSIFNGFCLESAGWMSVMTKPFLGRKPFMFGWLFSYLFTAMGIGIFMASRNTRKACLVTLGKMLLTGLYFLCVFRLKNLYIGASMILCGTVTTVVEMIITIKHTRFAWIGVLLNLGWYLLLFGLTVSVIILN